MKKSTELIIGYGEGISQEEDWGVYEEDWGFIRQTEDVDFFGTGFGEG